MPIYSVGNGTKVDNSTIDKDYSGQIRIKPNLTYPAGDMSAGSSVASASTTLTDQLFSHNAAATGNSATFVLVKTITVLSLNPSSLATNIAYEVMKNSPGNASDDKVVVDGVDGTLEGGISDNVWTQRSRQRTISSGSVIQLYVKCATAATVNVRNFRVLGTKTAEVKQNIALNT